MPITIKVITGQTVKILGSAAPIIKPEVGQNAPVTSLPLSSLPPGSTEAANDHSPILDLIPITDPEPVDEAAPGGGHEPGTDPVTGIDDAPGTASVPGTDQVPEADPEPGTNSVAATDSVPGADHVKKNVATKATAPSYPLPAAPPKTLGDVKRHLEQLKADGHGKDLSLMISAINSVTRKFPSTTPDDHSCNPAHLREKLAGSPCAEKDKGTWASIRSRLLRALTICGLEVMPGKRKHKLPPSWQALLDKLPHNQWVASLSRFFGFCARSHFEPADMCDTLATRFLHIMQETSMRGRPADIHRGAIRGWNNAMAQVEGWPQIKLTLPDIPRERSVLKLEEFTPAFQAALKANLAYLADPPEEDEDAPLKASAPNTLKQRDFRIRQIASGLIDQGIPRETLNGLADLVSKEKLDLLCAYLSGRHGKLATPMARSLLQIYASLARFQAQDPTLAKQIGKRLKVKVVAKLPPKGMTQKNRQRIAQFKDPDIVQGYALLPLILRQKARACAKHPRRAAVLMRAAVVIELEMMCPIRLANVASLTLDQHILPFTKAKKKAGMRLHIPAAEVKNDEDIDLELPETLVRLIEEYLRDYRKILIKPEFQHGQPIHLFPTPEGKAKTGKILAETVCETVKAELGINFNFHLFRHIGCYLYRQSHPGDYETMRRVLAHRNIETTARFYAAMEKEEAFKTFDKVMLELRDGHQLQAPKPTKPPHPAKLDKAKAAMAKLNKPSIAEGADVL